MDKIMDLLNNFSIEKYVPKLDSVMDVTQKAIELAMRVGPLCILVLGLIYMLIPPKEANRYFGFRTYFGMGSVSAWRFTQRISGAIMTVLGLVLLLIAKGAIKNFAGMDLMQMSEKAIVVIKNQIICALVLYVIMFLLTAVLFDRKGQYRFRKMGESKFVKLIGAEPARKKSVKKAPRQQIPQESVSKEVYPEEVYPEEVYSEEAYAEEEVSEEEYTVEYERQGEQVITVDDIVIEDLE